MWGEAVSRAPSTCWHLSWDSKVNKLQTKACKVSILKLKSVLQSTKSTRIWITSPKRTEKEQKMTKNPIFAREYGTAMGPKRTQIGSNRTLTSHKSRSRHQKIFKNGPKKTEKVLTCSPVNLSLRLSLRLVIISQRRRRSVYCNGRGLVSCGRELTED